jgi:hypothetical protein
VAERSSGEANFRISIDGNAAEATKEIASSARLAAKSITAYEDQIKTLSADMRRLKGNSEEVTAAKKKIKTQIDAAKESISLLTVELNKSGTSYAAAAASAKKFGTAVSPKEAWGKIGGAAGAAMKRLTAPLGKGLAKALGPVTKKIGDALGPLAKKAGEKLAPAGKALGRLGTSAKGAFSTLAAAAKPVTSMLPDAATMMSGLGTVAAGAAAAVVALGARCGGRIREAQPPASSAPRKRGGRGAARRSDPGAREQGAARRRGAERARRLARQDPPHR